LFPVKYLAANHQVVHNPESIASNRVQCLPYIGWMDVRQESKFAKIDAEHGDLLLSHLFGTTEYGAVTPNDDREISLDTDFLLVSQILEDNLAKLLNHRPELVSFFEELFAPVTGSKQQETEVTFGGIICHGLRFL
jgi:hypothetical protein